MAALLREVGMRQIEPELRRLWREQAGECARKARPLTRVRTLNLLIYSPETAREEMPALLDPLVAAHPARVIALHAAPGKAPRAWISAANIRSAPTGESIGRELITIEGGPDAPRELRSVVLPLLVHDLPVYLWWRGRPEFEMGLFRELARAADRIIVDSDEFAAPAVALPQMARTAPELHCALSDLAWARLTPWRQLTAQFFDPPHARHLQQLQSVVVEYGGELPARALLLAAWLASRLGWQPSHRQGDSPALQLTHGGTAITIEFRRAMLADRRLSALELSAPEAQFQITRLSGTGCFVTVSDVAGNSVRRRVPCQDQGEAAMISRELTLPGRDLVYEQALDMVRALLAG